MWAGALSKSVANERVARLERLELVKPGIKTGAVLAHERTLPVADGLGELVPSGVLQRGSTIAVHGVGATSYALALVAEAVRGGSFLAVVASTGFNLGACIDFDIPLRRVVQFVLPDERGWSQQVAAVIEGFDLVVLADRRRASPSQARQLAARARERGSVVVRVAGQSWSDTPDLRFDVRDPAWHGLAEGHGHLASRVVSVQVAGRRWPGPPRVRQLRMSGDGIELVKTPRLIVTEGRRQTLTRAEVTPGQPMAALAGGDSNDRFAGSDADELVRVAESQTSQPSQTNRVGQAGELRNGSVA